MDQNYEILIKSPTLCPHSPPPAPPPPPQPQPEKTANIGDATTGFPAKWRQRDESRNSILMMHHYPDLGSASDWLNQISHVARTIRSTTQIWVVTCHQYGISALVSQVSFGRETSNLRSGVIFFFLLLCFFATRGKKLRLTHLFNKPSTAP